MQRIRIQSTVEKKNNHFISVCSLVNEGATKQVCEVKNLQSPKRLKIFEKSFWHRPQSVVMKITEKK